MVGANTKMVGGANTKMVGAGWDSYEGGGLISVYQEVT